MGVRSGMVMASVLLGASVLPAYAATFEVPRNFEIMFVDLESPGKFGNDFKADVEPGDHQFVVRFHQRVGGGDNGEQFESEPYIIDVNVAKDAHIELNAPYFFRKSDAAEFEDNVEFTLVNNNSDATLDYEVRQLPHQSGVQQMRDYEEEVRRFTATYKMPTVDTPTQAAQTETDTEALEMLKFWYNRAAASTRKDMRIWLVDDSHKPENKNTSYEMLQFWFNKASAADQKAFQVWLLNE